MTKASSHNGYLDFLKFVFALGVMGVHTYLCGFSFRLVYCGYLGVDFFFMVSGYFTVREAVHARKAGKKESTPDYFAKRIKKNYPMFLGACIYSFVLMELINPNADVWMDLYNNIFDFTPLQVEIFPSQFSTAVQWYISALLVVSPLVYTLVLRFGRVFSLYFAPVCAAFLFGILQLYLGELSSVATLLWGWIFAGVVRAMADMFLSATIYELSQALGKVELSRFGYILVRCVRVALLCGAIRLCFMQTSGYGDFIFVADMFAYLILLFAFPVKYKIFESGLFSNLGRVSVTLFMVHVRTGAVINTWFSQWSVVQRIVCYYLASVAVAFVLYYIVRAIQQQTVLQRLLLK